MKIDHDQEGQLTVVRLSGEMTVDALEPLRKLVQDRLDADGRDFVFDLSEVEFIDSEGLEALLWARDAALEGLGQVRLAGPSENVRRILHVTRLGGELETHPGVDEARASLA